MEVHKQYNLRSKGSPEISNDKNTSTVVKKTSENQPKKTASNTNIVAKKIDINKDKNSQQSVEQSCPSTSASGPNKSVPNNSSKKFQQIKIAKRVVNEKTDVNMSKTIVPFSLEGEISKIKITIPLPELATQDVYKNHVLKALNIGSDIDTLKLIDDKPELLFGPEVEGKYQEGAVPPFYVSLNIHDKILHNAMLDSGASHNLMPKVVMESLGLEITKPYKDLYSFDSSRVKCLGLNKDMCVSLAQIFAKSLVMDIVVADIPPKYGMLLSRSWGAKLQGSLQMDMSYATIPVFNQTRRLYRESHMKYMVRNIDRPNNSPIYSIHSIWIPLSYIMKMKSTNKKRKTKENLVYYNNQICHQL